MQYISIMSLLFAFYTQIHSLDYLFDRTTTRQLHEIETEHFRIIFSDNSIEQAKYIVSIAEKEFTHFTKYYGPFHSKKKIRVVISSDYKSANGLASIFLFPVIHLYVSVPPRISDPHSNMGKEYLETLFRHELAHVIQLSFRKIFKKAKILDAINEMIHPAKVFSSRSFVEGAAVFVESQGKYGRLKDPYTYHLMRRKLLDNKFPSFSSIGGLDKTVFESLSYPYTFGSLLHQYLSENVDKDFDFKYWKSVGNGNISSLALKKISKKNYGEIRKDFIKSLEPKVSYTVLTDPLVRVKDRRIVSMQKINNKIYYFDKRRKELRLWDIKRKKDRHVMFGNQSWDFISISPDEKYILISGTAEMDKFISIIHRASMMPISRSFVGLYDGYFMSDSTSKNIKFVATNLQGNYPELVLVKDGKITTLRKGSSIEAFDSPRMIDNKYIYFLHSYNGDKHVSRIDIKTKKISKLDAEEIKFPRFLIADENSLSVSYAENIDSFYKRAIIQDHSLLLIKNNFKGEIFESTIQNKDLIFRASFSQGDNLFQIPLSDLKIQKKDSQFVKIQEVAVPEYSFKDHKIKKYKASIDLNPYIVIPFIDTKRSGLSTLMVDATGANEISTGININYFKGTPEFSLLWKNKELPIDFGLNINNRLVDGNETFQLDTHLLVQTGFEVNYTRISRQLLGKFSLEYSINWYGSITGDQSYHPFTWSHLILQQLISKINFTWKNKTNEGAYGFYRLYMFSLEQSFDILHPNWARIELYLGLSPPIVPIQFNLYGSYNTALTSISGDSVLGLSLIPEYKEYRKMTIHAKKVIYGSIDLLLYSWEIQKGIGFGEIFFHRWAFMGGYRGGFWGEHPYLHSIYLKTQFNMSLLFGHIPISFSLEGTYAFTINKWDYNAGFNSHIIF